MRGDVADLPVLLRKPGQLSNPRFVAWPFIGRKTSTQRQKEYNDVHGFYRARIELLFARPWHRGIVRNTWKGSGMELRKYVRVLLHLQYFFYSKAGTVPSIWAVGTRTCTCMDRTYTRGH